MGKNKKYKPKNNGNQASNSLSNQFSKTSLNVTNIYEDFQAVDFQDQMPKQFLQQFKFSLKQLIKLGLAKYFPPKDKNILIDLQKQIISGEKTKVLAYYEDIKKQNQKKVMKLSFFDTLINPDEIQMEMDEDWNCKIFTSNTFQKVIDNIQKTYNLGQQTKQLTDQIYKNKNPKFLRLLLCDKQYAQQAVDKLKFIYNQSKKSQKKQKAQEDSQESSQNQSNYYKDVHSNIKKQNSNIEFSKILSQKSLSKKDICELQNLIDTSRSGIAKRQAQQETNIPKKRGNRQFQHPQKRQYRPKRSNRYSSSDDEQNNNKNQEILNKTSIQPQRKQRIDAKLLFFETFPESKFDQTHFKNWIKQNRYLQSNQVNVTTRYNEKSDEKLFQVTVSTYRNTSEKQNAILMYMKFQKIYVIKNVEKQEVLEHLKEKFNQKQSWMQVEYDEIFTYQKFPDAKRLRLLRKNSSKVNKNSCHKIRCFIITGLIPQVDSMASQIDFYIKNLPKNDEPKDIIIQFNKLKSFIRDEEVFNLVKQTIQGMKQKFVNVCSIKQVYRVLNDIVVTVQVKHDHINQLIGIQTALKAVQTMISIQKFQKSKYQQSKYVFESLKDQYIFRQDQNKDIILIQKSQKFGATLALIHQQIGKNKILVQKTMSVQSKAKLLSIEAFITKIKKQKNDQYQSLKFHTKSQGQKYQIVFYGYDAIIKLIQFQIQTYLVDLQSRTYEFSHKVSNIQADLIQNADQFKKKIFKQYQMNISIKKNLKLPAIISIDLNPNESSIYPIKKVIIQDHFNILSLPSNSIIFFREKSEIQKYKLTSLLHLKGKCRLNLATDVFHEDIAKNCVFYYKFNVIPSFILEQCQKKYDEVNAFVHMPKNLKQKKQFIQKLLYQFRINKLYLKKNVKITLIQSENIDYRGIVNIPQNQKKNFTQKTKKWYTVDGAKKIYYSKLGNDKINFAFNSKKNSVQLTNQDLEIKSVTHVIDVDKKIMTHQQSGKQFPINVNGVKITFALNGVQKQLPKSQVCKIPKTKFLVFGMFKKQEIEPVQICLGYYDLKFNQKQQINLFSGFSRVLDYVEEQIINATNRTIVSVEYDVKATHYVLAYPLQQNKHLKKAIQQIDEFLSEKCTKQVVDLTKTISYELVKSLQIHAQQYQIRMEYLDKKSVSLYSYDKKNIDRFINMIKVASNKEKPGIQYPPMWQPQKDQIQIFVVPPNSQQFADVQKNFTVRPIVQLVRIQNQIIYKKYFQQKIFLTQLNEGKVPKQMDLFHGTRKTEPSLIYADKEQAFNINYTSQSNLLGKGAYFAVKSQYSHKYCYQQPNPARGAFSMFYCKVLVGQSQKFIGNNYDSNIKDTGYKNVEKRIRYQSLTAFRQGSDIYVVYKSRRAYPMYIIKYN